MIIYYQIIPWEYFSPEEYVFVRECIEGKDIYVLKADGKVIDREVTYNEYLGVE